MRGIVSAAGYVPWHRLDRAAIGDLFGTAPGTGTRAVASYDEDTTTMAVEASRFAIRSREGNQEPTSVLLATAEPAYQEKTNATALHAALRLDPSVCADDLCGNVRGGTGALGLALRSSDPLVLVATAGIRTGLPTGPDEERGGDGAAALLIGADTGTNGPSPLLAEWLGGASRTEEFLDRWRSPGSSRTKQWEDRFGESVYVALGEEAWNAALKEADGGTGLDPAGINTVVVCGPHTRACASLRRRLGVEQDVFADDLSGSVGNTGAAHPLLLLTRALEHASPGQIIALVTLADGADVLLFRTTDAIAKHDPFRSVDTQIEEGARGLPYGKFLAWRGMLELEPPRRPEPPRPAAPPSQRNRQWKFAFTGSRDRSSGALHLPPQRVSWDSGALDEMEPAPMADSAGTIVTFTVDRLAYSPSPPVVFAVVDFDTGGRLPCELTDVDPGTVSIGDRVEMTFRRLHTADGIHNYFWKARPIRDGR